MSYEVYCPFLEKPFLIIPEDKPPIYSTKPLKWIRYAAFAVLGVEGDLMKYIGAVTRENDLSLDLDEISPSERKLMFHPTSPIKFVDQKGYYYDSIASYMTKDSKSSSQKSFKDKVVQRDKIGVGLEYHNDLVPWHIIPSIKGSEGLLCTYAPENRKYIQSVCRWRNSTEDPGIEDINDIRNGVLLDFDTRAWCATGSFGVLHTPNFALSVDEVLPPTTKPHQDTTHRFTPHCFVYDYVPDHGKVFFNHLIKDFRYPTLDNGWPVDWPPGFLWDFHYGVAIAKEYGNKEVMDTLSDEVKSRYKCEEGYEEEDSLEEDVDLRDEAPGGSRGEQASDAMDNVLSMSMLYSPRVNENAEKASGQEQEKRHQVAEKVNAWMTNVGTN